MIFLSDSKLYDKDLFGLSFDFLISNGLIEYDNKSLSYKVIFVGEVITPHSTFFSFPKDFSSQDNSSYLSFKRIFKEFKNLKKNGASLIQNKTFDFGNEIKSEYYYWLKLFSYFSDYITYEFYYPKKRLNIHSYKKINGSINPIVTEINRNRYGGGTTYQTKDFKENYLRNIFYTILKKLELKYADDSEQKTIKELEKQFKFKNIEFKIIDIDKEVALSIISSTLNNGIHDSLIACIKNYLKDQFIKEKATINIFYTKEFEYLLEFLFQRILSHDIKNKNPNWIDPSFKSLKPDIFAKNFIADIKYYNFHNILKQSFEKEMYAYNVANVNSQPNFLIWPGDETFIFKKISHTNFNLILTSVSYKHILADYFNNETNTLNHLSRFIDEEFN